MSDRSKGRTFDLVGFMTVDDASPARPDPSTNLAIAMVDEKSVIHPTSAYA
ncbi:hypothetical protein [Phytopseudomonas daroniae]|uniref:hypothetical protein n=1 Tax=Phytopseudomonas daroniae TaxID=2487519 RepID=UPI0013F156FD|nr:hypothetical protein [Pseudomonas daroniae]